MRFKVVIFFLLVLFIIKSAHTQTIERTHKYYYKKKDSSLIVKYFMSGSSNVKWDIILKKIKYKSKKDSVCLKMKYCISLGTECLLLDIDYFVVDRNFNIVKKVTPKIRKKYFILDECIAKEQTIAFCLDGGEVYVVKFR